MKRGSIYSQLDWKFFVIYKKLLPKNLARRLKENVRFEDFTPVTMNNAVFWDVSPCTSCVNRRFGGTSVYTRSTWRHIPEDGILQLRRSLQNATLVDILAVI
jgi:hypothetical protein